MNCDNLKEKDQNKLKLVQVVQAYNLKLRKLRQEKQKINFRKGVLNQVCF